MTKRVLGKTLRTDTVTLILVLIAFAVVTSLSITWLVSRSASKPLGKPEKQLSADVQGRLDAVLDTYVSQGHVAGAIVGIWVPGEGTWVRVRGFADQKTHQPMMATDKFRIASITKTFVATVALQLVDEKRLGLDDPVSKYLPSLPNGSSITVRQLLNHTSGLFDFVEDSAFQKASTSNPLKKWTQAQLLAYGTSHAPYFAPGTGWHYSNTNYIVLGLIIEAVTGQKVGAVIDSKILKPLQLQGTTYMTGLPTKEPYSKGYVNDNGILTEASDIDPSAGGASSAMMSDMADLKVWAEALGRGDLLSREAQAERMKTGATDGSPMAYGLGIMKWGDFVGHEGNAFGYSTAMFYLPSKRATIVVFLNSVSNSRLSATNAFIRFAQVLFGSQTP